jgi:hypothetical protein
MNLENNSSNLLNNKIAILPIDKLKKDDKLMRKNYNYTESKLFKQL